MVPTIYRYRVVFEKEKAGGYSAYCPALKGAVSQGNTYEEAYANIHEAIEGWLAVAREFGDPIPPSDILEQTLVEVAA